MIVKLSKQGDSKWISLSNIQLDWLRLYLLPWWAVFLSKWKDLTVFHEIKRKKTVAWSMIYCVWLDLLCHNFYWMQGVLMYSVFVQCRWVSCHCGHQGTVVNGRICLYSRGNLQIHLFVVLINFSCKSGWSVVTHSSMLEDVKEELRFGSGILSVPL